MSETDDAARRAYWTAQMEDAYAFVLTVARLPVAECGERVTALPAAAAAAGVEVEFSTEPHVLGLPRLHYLRAALVPPFVAAAREMNARGWVLKVEDGYRTVEMQRHLPHLESTLPNVLRKVIWENGGEVPSVALLSRRVAALIAPSARVGTHMSATALDIGVLDRETRKEVDRGGPYVDLSERTPMRSPYISEAAQRNRAEITELMLRHGFVAYPWEFWHYNAGDVYAHHLLGIPDPARYGPVAVDLDSGEVTALERPAEPLNTPEEMAELMARALAANP